MKIYIAGPYTKPNPEWNTRFAIYTGDYVASLGHTVFIPHLTHYWHLVKPHEYEFWMKQDFEWLKMCDALLRIPGESAGADREVQLAKELGMPVYYSIFAVPRKPTE